MRSMAPLSRHFSLSLEHMLEMKVRAVQQSCSLPTMGCRSEMHRSARVLSSWGAGIIARTEHEARVRVRRHEATSQRNGRFGRSRLLGRWLTVDCAVPRQPPFLTTPLRWPGLGQNFTLEALNISEAENIVGAMDKNDGDYPPERFPGNLPEGLVIRAEIAKRISRETDGKGLDGLVVTEAWRDRNLVEEWEEADAVLNSRPWVRSWFSMCSQCWAWHGTPSLAGIFYSAFQFPLRTAKVCNSGRHRLQLEEQGRCRRQTTGEVRLEDEN